MNSFRVLNARFRILKGGNIGLSLSIFLLGSMLTLSKTNALATDYFNSVQVNTTGVIPSSSGTHGTANVQQRFTSGTTVKQEQQLIMLVWFLVLNLGELIIRLFPLWVILI